MKRIINALFSRWRCFHKNLYYFSTLKKRVSFGKNSVIRGNVTIGNKVSIDNNVEVRNLTKEPSSVGSYTSINRNTVLRGKYQIGDNVAIGPNCSIMGFNHRFDDPNILLKLQGNTVKGIIIESNVWLGANVLVLDGVTIGEGSVIGGGSVVTKSIPSYSIAVGNPCKIIKNRKDI